jgi:hypothetical protein
MIREDILDCAATITDLRASLAAAMARARDAEAKLAREFERGFLQGRNVATPVQSGGCRVPGCDCNGLLWV